MTTGERIDSWIDATRDAFYMAGRRLGIKRFQPPPALPLTATERAALEEYLRLAKEPLTLHRYIIEQPIPGKYTGEPLTFRQCDPPKPCDPIITLADLKEAIQVLEQHGIDLEAMTTSTNPPDDCDPGASDRGSK